METPTTSAATSTPKQTAVLHYPGGTYPMPIRPATSGHEGIDITGLAQATGYVTYDPGYASTGSSESTITYIDGVEGILRYRGYDIADLAANASFTEVSHLLVEGELPTASQLELFDATLRAHQRVEENLAAHFSVFPRYSHPMAVLASSVNILATYYPQEVDVRDVDCLERASFGLLAQVPMLAAYAYRASQGKPCRAPDLERSVVENLVTMMFHDPGSEVELDPVLLSALDKLFVLHADHEQNCSTSTVRMIGSAHANMAAAVAGGINALSGPLHGGANQAVVEMLETIRRDYRGDAAAFMRSVKDHPQAGRLMGFGHRVYKNYDPRALIVKDLAHDILSHLRSDNLLDIALQLEEIVLRDEYFVSRQLYPNVDFYTGVIYQAMGFPTDMFTVLFTLGRLPGWIAHYREQVTTMARIKRPRQIYTGADLRPVPPLSARG